MENIYSIFGYLVRSARKKKGWTSSQLAAKLAMKEPYIRSVERGKCRTPFHAIAKIANVLGIDLNTLREY